MRKRVYIAGPISKGDLAHNIDRATQAFVALSKAGLAPFCPHWSVYSGPAQLTSTGGTVYAIASPQPNELSHSDWLAVDLAWVDASEAVLRIPGESVGADMEVKYAGSRGIPVFHSIDEVVAWANAA